MASKGTIGSGVVTWRSAALRVGEQLAAAGPNGYYDLTPTQWLAWVMAQAPMRGSDPCGLQEQSDRLRAALVGIVGVDGRAELEQMEAVMRLMPVPAEDKARTIDAIHALLATLPASESADAVAGDVK